MSWSSQNKTVLNTPETVEMVVDFRKDTAPPSPITLLDSPVDIAESIRFPKWELNLSSIISKAQPRMELLLQLKVFSMPDGVSNCHH